MKTFVVSILIFTTFSVYAQDNKITVAPTPKAKKVEQPNSELSDEVQNNKVTSNETNYPMNVSYSREQKSNASVSRTVEDVDVDIANIKAKMDYVKSNPEMDAKARAEGWYAKNETLIDNLKKEKSNLLKK